MFRPSHRTLPACLALMFLAAGMALASDLRAGDRPRPARDRLTIHEWGTFTCLHDEQGRALGGVNSDDERVPDFVHRISDLIPRPTDLAPIYYKGVPRAHSDVVMRLETPVLYFYPPDGSREPLHAAVEVGFRGGWLTEYFPQAHVRAPGLEQGEFRYGPITSRTAGSLHWSDLTIGGQAEIPATDAPVWLAPRQVRAATVRVPGGEAEKYLFYRGVGNLPSLLTVTREGARLAIRESVDTGLGLRAPLVVRAAWLVHVRGDGTVAFRPLGRFELTGETGRLVARQELQPDAMAATTSEPAASAENLLENYAPQNLTALRETMRRELIADGLYDDEAEAMLKTWELAYFKSPGLRLFYLLPQQWTDAVLPLRCSLVADVSRTMVGRIEIVTPRQRQLIHRISRTPLAEIGWIYRYFEQDAGNNQQLFARLWKGELRLNETGAALPPEYRDYLELGRFRDALLLDATTRGRNHELSRFTETYHIEYYNPPVGAEDRQKTAASP